MRVPYKDYFENSTDILYSSPFKIRFLFLLTFYLLFQGQSFASNQPTRACVPTVAPLVANGFLFTRPYSLIKTYPLIRE
jgi:hypothetical protein